MSADNTFTIAKGDRLPVLVETLYNGDGSVIDGTGATVQLILTNVASDVTVTLSGSWSDAAAGIAQYAWASGDTDTAGTYRRQWKITFSSTKVVHVPNDRDGYPVEITGTLG